MSDPQAPTYATERNPELRSLGGVVAYVAQSLGTPLMPWQRLVADVACEVVSTRPLRFRYPLVIVTVPRQAGKTTLLRAVALQRAVMLARCRVFMTAQTGKDAHARWKDTIEVIERSALGPHVKVNRAAGAPTLTLPNASQVRSFAPTPKSIHGETPPLVMVDEAWAFDAAQGEDLMGAIRPAQITLPERQLWLVSTKGDEDSTFLNAWIEAGRLAVRDPEAQVAFFEWSAADGADAYDEDTWAFHPALGHTITLDDLRDEAANASRGTWERAFMNRPTQSAESIIDLDAWDDLAGEQVRPAWETCALGVDASQDAWAVYAAWDHDGTPNVRMVAEGPGGPEGLATYLNDLLAAAPPASVTGDDSGPVRRAFELVTERAIDPLKPRDFASACGSMLRAARRKGLRHDGSRALHDAWAGAALKFLADQEAFDRRKSTGPTEHLIAATCALRSCLEGPTAVGRPFLVI